MLTVTATLPVLLLASTFCNYYSLPVVLLGCAPCAAPCAVPATHAVPNHPMLVVLHFPLCALALG